MNKKKNVYYSNIFSEESIAYYQQNIIDFVYDIIFQNKPEYFLSDQQKEFLLAIQNNDKVSVKSGRGVGKTASVSFAVIWFLCCFAEPKVVCSAPSAPTLSSALWPEIALWLSRSLVKDLFEHTEKKCYLKEQGKNWWAVPRTANSKESASGLHMENMLIIIDEASGMRDDIFDAFDGTLTGKNNKFVLISNPTKISGPFYDTFNRFKNKWFNLTFNGEESPFVKKEQIDYYADKYGITHDLYLVNIKGLFPSGNVDSFIPLTKVQGAFDRYQFVEPNGDIEIGLDVARYGDDNTVLTWRRGYKVYPSRVLSKNSIPEAAQLVIDTVVEIRQQTGYEKKIKVKIDSSGLGAGVCDLLKQDREHNIQVIECNFGGAGDDKYHNEASIMWGNVKDIIDIIALPDCEIVDGKTKHTSFLLEELSSRRWKVAPNGKTLIESKSEYKKEFKSSPDRADALVLCFARKEAENVVLKNLDVLDKQTIKVVHYMGEEKYGAIFYGKDMTVSVVYTAWDGSRLYIYDEYVGSDSLVRVAANIIQHPELTRLIGNDRMFGVNTDSMENRFRQYKIRIHENYSYDEISSIDTLMNLTAQKRLIINPNCKKTIDQLSSWKIDKNRIEQEREYGLCYALSHIMFFLRRKFTQPVVPLVVSGYDKKGFQTVDDDKSWMRM